MHITVQDIINIEPLKSLKLIAGAGGLDQKVSKIGILDYEYTKRGSSFISDEHWQPNEFVLTTFIYAKDSPSALLNTIKRLYAKKTSGIAIKNVYGLEITREVIYYANKHHFPVFIFTDNNLFFENVIITVEHFMNAMADQRVIEKNIASLLNEEYEKNTIKKKALGINYAFKNQYTIAYCALKQDIAKQKLSAVLRCNDEILGRGMSLAKYGNGFFYIRSIDSSKKQLQDDIILQLQQSTGLDINEFHIGVSETQYFLENFKKALQQSYYAHVYSRVTNGTTSHYAEIGVYKLLIPFVNEDIYNDYFDQLTTPIMEYDENHNTDLFETALLYEECHGNIKEVASRLNSHDNTVRYRIKKLAEILGMDLVDGNFTEQLNLAVKIYKINKVMNTVNS